MNGDEFEVHAAMLTAIALLQGSPASPSESPGAIAIILDTSISTHVELSAALQRQLPYRTVERTVSQPWAESQKPLATITLTHGAQRWVDTFAPGVPHAALLRWSSDPIPQSPPAQLLIGSGHTEAECTAEVLSRRSRDTSAEHRLIIWATPTDTEAPKIAGERLASLVTGGPTELAALLDAERGATTEIFIRTEPSISHSIWLERLGYLDKSRSFHVGSDAPGTARFGIEQWVRRDLEAHATQVSRWISRKLKRRQRRRSLRAPSTPTHIAIPCIP